VRYVGDPVVAVIAESRPQANDATDRLVIDYEIGSTPAIVNAVVDALAPFGVTNVDMPAQPERIRKLMQNGAQTPHR
jgi:CO/xanthine dehydrogenase Mo-binding subunit